MKIEALNDPDQCEVQPGKNYSKEEARNATICLKSITTRDLEINDFVVSSFPHCTLVGLIRNGFAFCNSSERRGKTACWAGTEYQSFCRKILWYQKNIPDYITIRFEDMISDPFATAAKLYSSLELIPDYLDNIRLKSKAVLKPDGSHKVIQNSIQDRHYWFDRESVKSFIDPDVNKSHLAMLSEKSKNIFLSFCKTEMEELGYL